jgi:hypothetical protein
VQLYGIFKKPKNQLEKSGRLSYPQLAEDAELANKCPKCGAATPVSDLWEAQNVCKSGTLPQERPPARKHCHETPTTFFELYSDLASMIFSPPRYEASYERVVTRGSKRRSCAARQNRGRLLRPIS